MNHEDYEKRKLALERGEEHALEDIAYEEHLSREVQTRIAVALEKIAGFLTSKPAATKFTFRNTGDAMPSNFTYTPGQSGQVTGTPNGALQAGNVPVWTVDNPLVSITADPTGLVVAFATAATDTATGFTLTLSGVASDGTAISSSQLLTATPVAPTPATGFTFVQNS